MANGSDQNEIIFFLDNGVRFVPEKRFLISLSGHVVNLSENSYRFLTLLLDGENDKQKIINQIWHEQRGVVSDSSYYGQIYALRKAFELVGLPGALIKTIPRRGVKYTGKVIVKPLAVEEDRLPASAIDHQEVSLPAEDEATPMVSVKEKPKKPVKSRFDHFISIIAILAVCWLTTLTVLVVKFVMQVDK